MLASFVVHLKPLQPAFLNRNSGPIIHALFLNLIAETDNTLACSLHQDTPQKPFTVSPLQGKFARTGGHLVTLMDNPYWFRITTLEENVFAALSRTLMSRLAYHKPIDLGDGSFEVTDVKLEPTDLNVWGGITSFEEIYENASSDTAIALFFYSPTTFKQKRKNLPFPLPAVVFGGYLQRWNAFSPIPLDNSFLSWVEDNLAVEAHNIRTKMTPFDDFQLTGFTGVCRYRALKLDAAKVKILNALADFAFYCGTGAKTTMGMGQTRRIK